MLTSDDIRKAAQKFYDNQEFQCGWEIGATWANKQNAQEIAELKFRVEGDAILLQAADQTIKKGRSKIEILQGAYDTAKDHANALSAENAQLREALEECLPIVKHFIKNHDFVTIEKAEAAIAKAKPINPA